MRGQTLIYGWSESEGEMALQQQYCCQLKKMHKGARERLTVHRQVIH